MKQPTFTIDSIHGKSTRTRIVQAPWRSLGRSRERLAEDRDRLENGSRSLVPSLYSPIEDADPDPFVTVA